MQSPTRPYSTIELLGIHIAALTVDELHQIILQTIRARERKSCLCINVYGMNLIYENPWYRDIFDKADVVFCDGAGLQLAAHLAGKHLPQRITYADWMWQLAEFCETYNLSLYFLGGQAGVADKAAQTLRQRFPGLRIVGTHHGYFDKTPNNPENEAVVNAINDSGPDILLIGFGMPLQEKWLSDNWPKLTAHIGLTGGAVFDYISGSLSRGPRWMTDNGMEWLARLIIEPKRLWRRYVIGNPLFFWRFLKSSLMGKPKRLRDTHP